MFTGVLGLPMSWLLVGFVVWYPNAAGTLVAGAMLHPTAVAVPPLIIVAKALATIPTCTARLLGNTEEARRSARDWTAFSASARPNPKSLSCPAGPRSAR